MTAFTRAASVPADTAPMEILNSDSARPILIISDHAGRAVPEGWVDAVGPLGLAPEFFEEHIAWDIGAGGVARRLARRLEAAAVIAVYTRLLIDLNRALGSADCIPATSDGTAIPANQALTFSDLEARATAFYWPYHRTIDLQLARLQRSGAVPLLFSVHSFTPALRIGGGPRPWHASVMAGRDRRLADPLFAALQSQGLTVGFNEPYSGVTHAYCVKAHAQARGLPHVQIEIRQDLIASEAGQEQWAERLAQIISPLLCNSTLQSIEHF